MNNLGKIQKAVDFIEDNLKEEINLDIISMEACCSKFHFHRIFQKISGENVFDYIRKRRLFHAANEILYSRGKISSIANDFQFRSPEAFSRSFKKAFGVSPVEYRKNGKKHIHMGRVKLTDKRLKHYNFTISIEPEIRKIAKVELAGKEVVISKDNYQSLIDVWLKIKTVKIDHETIPDIYEVHKFISEPYHLVNYDENSVFHRLISTPIFNLNSFPDGFTFFQIPEGDYAVFTHKGTRYDTYLTTDFIWSVWLMKNEIELEDRPSFEYYGKKYLGPDDPRSQIEYYLPIK